MHRKRGWYWYRYIPVITPARVRASSMMGMPFTWCKQRIQRAREAQATGLNETVTWVLRYRRREGNALEDSVRPGQVNSPSHR